MLQENKGASLQGQSECKNRLEKDSEWKCLVTARDRKPLTFGWMKPRSTLKAQMVTACLLSFAEDGRKSSAQAGERGKCVREPFAGRSLPV
jgi:hypothetical protein